MQKDPPLKPFALMLLADFMDATTLTTSHHPKKAEDGKKDVVFAARKDFEKIPATIVPDVPPNLAFALENALNLIIHP